MPQARTLFLGVLIVNIISPAHAQQQWTLFEETYILGSISGSVKHGHIFKTATGNTSEVTDYVYLYEYEYSPEVMVLRSGDLYKLLIKGFDEPLICRRLNPDKPQLSGPQARKSTTNQTPDVIESTIVSDLRGLNQGNIYKLANGQIWGQTEAWVWVWVWSMPQVIIWKSDGVYKMEVEPIEHPVVVRRIK